MRDLHAAVPTATRLHQLLDRIEPHSADGLDGARALIGSTAADDLRSVGLEGAVPRLAEAFTAPR